MEKAQIYDLMIRLLRAYLFNGYFVPTADVLDQETLSKLYTISKQHDLAHVIGAALNEYHLLPADAGKGSFYQKQVAAVYRYERTMHEQKKVYELFEKHQIPFLPLKGAVLRDYYKEPWMRTSCDIDILVHEADLERAMRAMQEKLQYRSDERKGSHDISLYSPSNVQIELHYKFYEQSIPLDEVWDSSVLADGSEYHRLMTEELYYCYHVAHMAKHFESGGCGVRTFVDLQILRNRFTYDEEKIRQIMTDGGLYTFMQAAERLAAVWFAEGQSDDLSREMQDYIIGAGVYGSLENKVVVYQRKEGGRMKYALSRVFLPYETMVFHYPSIKGRKYLLPFYQVRRWFKIAFKGGAKRAMTELELSGSVSADKQKHIRGLLEELGL